LSKELSIQVNIFQYQRVILAQTIQLLKLKKQLQLWRAQDSVRTRNYGLNIQHSPLQNLT